MRKLPRFSFFLVLIVLLAAPAVLMAQGSQVGNLQGQIRDESGGVLPGVSVTATSQERGFSRNTVSDGNGKFLFAGVSYHLRAVAQLRSALSDGATEPEDAPTGDVGVP